MELLAGGQQDLEQGVHGAVGLAPGAGGSLYVHLFLGEAWREGWALSCLAHSQ